MSERVLVLQLDGTALPNRACARVAGEHRARGDDVVFRYSVGGAAAQRTLWDGERFDRVYASLLFEKTRPRARALLEARPGAIVGGTGWDKRAKLEDAGIASEGPLDWSIYPTEMRSVGFSQRGCGLACGFCHVPIAEGKVREVATVPALWRGEPWPRDLVLLDNDFFGAPNWRDRVAECRGFRVSLTQGINARLIGVERGPGGVPVLVRNADGKPKRDRRGKVIYAFSPRAAKEEAEALASMDLWDDRFRSRRIYVAWDSVGDAGVLFRGLGFLRRAGIKPDRIMAYMLIGWESSEEQDLYRVSRLRRFGVRPYPMPFKRTPPLVGFARWVVGAYDKRIEWDAWKAARYRPERLGEPGPVHQQGLFA